jgi:hypothetical protein
VSSASYEYEISANIVSGCTYIDNTAWHSLANHSRRDAEDKKLISGRLMSDYEVTLVNDNSMRSLQESTGKC